MGRRALFSPPAAAAGQHAEGRLGLFSAGGQDRPEGAHGVAVVECRTCLARTPVGVAEMVASLIPSLWLPGRKWSRLMICPACKHPAWCRLERKKTS